MKSVKQTMTWFLLCLLTLSSLGMSPLPLEVPENESASRLLQYTANGHVLGFAPDKVYLAGLDHALTVSFVGGKRIQPQGVAGSGESKNGVAPVGTVTYAGVWPGVDVVYKAINGGIAESTYLLAPGAKAESIRLKYNVPVELMKDGTLQFAFENGYLTESAPVAWQEINGKRVAVDVHFEKHSESEVGFILASSNPAYAVTIDPSYSWHTFYGGTIYDCGHDIAVDGNGNIYVTGVSQVAWNGPGAVTPLHTHAGGSGGDIVVVKLNASGAYQWHTFYGSANADNGTGIALDGSGNVYVTGVSLATWTGPGAVAPLNAYAGSDEIVVVKLNSAGAYQWHTFYGSASYDGSNDITVDGSGNVYVTGYGNGTWNGPGAVAPLNPHAGSSDIVVVKLNSAGVYQWHTFYGSADGDSGNGIALDGSGNVYMTGYSYATWNGPGAVAPLNAFGGGFVDIIVIKLNNAGVYQWHTFYGPGNNETGNDITVDGSGNVYVVGTGDATWNGPGGTAPLHAHAGGGDIVVIKLNATGAYQWHTFYGSADGDSGYGIALDGSGNIYVTGGSQVTWNGPGAVAPLNPHAGSGDIVVVKLNSAGAYQWHTFYGSAMGDSGMRIAVDGSRNIYATGYSDATWNGPGAAVPLNAHSGNTDIMVVKTTSNQIPTNITLSASSVTENQPAGTTVGSFTTTDPDAGDTFTYSFCEGADDASFTIAGNVLKTAAVFDYETKNSYSICVRSTDSGSLHFDKTFTITVRDVVENAAPTNISLSASVMNENQPSGTTVGTFTTTDPNVGDAFSYAFCGGTNDASFTIAGNVLKTAAVFDFETKSSYSICVRSTDSGSLHFDKTFTITVTDVAENAAPTDLALSASLVTENQPAGTTVGTFTTIDPDAGDTFTYSLISGDGSADNAAFTINGNALQTSYPLNYLSKNSYSIRVRTTDVGGLSFEKVFTITVTDQPAIFADVTANYWSASWIERLFNAGITGGCSTSPLNYCPENPVTRAQMAIFLERGLHGSSFSPPAAQGTKFGDVPVNHWAAKWIEALAADGITSGCGGSNYCPESLVTRAQMAVFLLKSKHGVAYTPSLATGTKFSDVSPSYWAAVWIEQLANEGITGGCGNNNYCPDSPVTRAQMAVFLVRTFDLP